MLEDPLEFSISSQCDMLSLNRTGIYYKAREISPEKQAILNAMDEIFTENPFYGSRRIAVELHKQGYDVCRPTVSSYMKILGIEAIYQKPDLSKPHPNHKIYPYLLRNVKVVYPNQIWGTDITYIRMRDGFMYLVAYLDWYSRYVVAWELSDTMEEEFVIQALKAALKVGKPHIVNSDQGSQFTGKAHINYIASGRHQY